MGFKKQVSRGDCQQFQGHRSEKKIPIGKFFGLRKFDYIQTSKGAGFVKGKRSSGCFVIFIGTKSVKFKVKKDCIRLNARTTTLTERGKAYSPTGQAAVVYC